MGYHDALVLAFEIIGYSYIGLCALCLFLYIPRMIYWFEYKKPHKKYHNDKINDILLVVPARQESQVIGRLLKSILAQTYDRAHFKVVVVVDNKTDPSIKIVEDMLGDEISHDIVIVPDQHCKGDALDGGLKHVLECGEHYDEVLIVDADNKMKEDMLAELNNAMVKDTDVIICNRRNLNLLSDKKHMNNWVSNCSGLTHALLNEEGNWYRSEHGLFLTFCGTGLAFKFKLVEEMNGWEYKLLAEDYQFGTAAVAKGYTAYYAPDVVTWCEEVTTVRGDVRRRARWLIGYVVSRSMYKKDIKKAQKVKDPTKNKFRYFDYKWSLAPLIMWIVVSLVATFSSLGVFLAAICSEYMELFDPLYYSMTFFMIFIPIVFLYLGLLIFTALMVRTTRKTSNMNKRQALVTIFTNPIYMALYLIVLIVATFSNPANKKWAVNKRLDIDDV
ncbi:MAG: glycosyltransferase family 2 protein [Coprobacillus sp.]|nr:glycosyltransferase family 2 protein [Coprobacillus sp.]